ncbi:unnamed protein product [Amoebophrya sp. A25]|nr:unnamed protein product [Amoebophrya sp. A25]|eukprot:GSA25T00003903001.1
MRLVTMQRRDQHRKETAVTRAGYFRRFLEGAWPFLLVLTVELYDDWYTRFTSGYTCPPWYLPETKKFDHENGISQKEAQYLEQKASRAFVADARDLLLYVAGARKEPLGKAYHDEVRDAVCPVGYEYDFPVSGTTWRWEFSPQWMGIQNEALQEHAHALLPPASTSSDTTRSPSSPGTSSSPASSGITRSPLLSSSATSTSPFATPASGTTTSTTTSILSTPFAVRDTYDSYGRFLFWISMWPGFDVLLLLLLILFRRGVAELLLLVGVVVQGLAPTTVKRSLNCYGLRTGGANKHWVEEALCPYWMRPHTSCLDDCGMVSGHANVAFFYLGWGLPYLLRSGLLLELEKTTIRTSTVFGETTKLEETAFNTVLGGTTETRTVIEKSSTTVVGETRTKSRLISGNNCEQETNNTNNSSSGAAMKSYADYHHDVSGSACDHEQVLNIKVDEYDEPDHVLGEKDTDEMTTTANNTLTQSIITRTFTGAGTPRSSCLGTSISANYNSTRSLSDSSSSCKSLGSTSCKDIIEDNKEQYSGSGSGNHFLVQPLLDKSGGPPDTTRSPDDTTPPSKSPKPNTSTNTKTKKHTSTCSLIIDEEVRAGGEEAGRTRSSSLSRGGPEHDLLKIRASSISSARLLKASSAGPVRRSSRTRSIPLASLEVEVETKLLRGTIGAPGELQGKSSLAPPKTNYRGNKTKRFIKKVVAIAVLVFLLLQPYVIVALGDHTPLQGFIGALTGGLAGFAFYRYILSDDVVYAFVASDIGIFLGFHDNYTI